MLDDCEESKDDKKTTSFLQKKNSKNTKKIQHVQARPISGKLQNNEKESSTHIHINYDESTQKLNSNPFKKATKTPQVEFMLDSIVKRVQGLDTDKKKIVTQVIEEIQKGNKNVNELLKYEFLYRNNELDFFQDTS